MAYDFTTANNDQISINSPLVSAYPFTLSAWFNADTSSTTESILSINDAGGPNNAFSIAGRSDNVVRVWDRDPSDETAQAFSSNTYTTGTWNHVVGRYISLSSRNAYLNGDTVNKGTNTVTVSDRFAQMDNTCVGRFLDSSPSNTYDGKLAEVAIWNVDIGEDKIVQLSKGYSPLFFPAGLIAYWPLIRSVDDIVGGSDFTTNTADEFNIHPPIIYPHMPFALGVPAAAAGGLGIPLVMHYRRLLEGA